MGNREPYFLKRPVDLLFSAAVLLLLSPALIVCMIVLWLQDYHSPLYPARRVGQNNVDFTMIKIRSMIVNAEATGVNSTGAQDDRITGVGKFIRRFKIDELSQFLNVLVGNMSIVGPRPNTRKWGVDLYTVEEQRLLSLRPGITDLSSIVFSDEGDILANSENTDLTYNQIIRPWKSRLGLFYLDHASLSIDMKIIWLTAIAIFNKRSAIEGVVSILESRGASAELVSVCRRTSPLPTAPPPGSNDIEQGAIYSSPNPNTNGVIDT